MSNLGAAYHSQHKYDEAISVYEKTIGLDPGNAITAANLGSALSDVGRLDEAIRIYQELIERDPGFTEIRSNLLFINNYSSTRVASSL